MSAAALRFRALVTAVVLGAIAATVAPAPSARAAGDRAAIVIGGGGAVALFDGSISGMEALRQVASVTTLGFSGTGTAVCSINGVGNAATPSECLIGPNGEYWQYWRKAPGASGWSYSSAGAGTTSVVDGAMEGWVYAAARTAPPNLSFCSVVDCSPPTTTPPPTVPASGGGSGSATPSGGPSTILPGSPEVGPTDSPTSTSTTSSTTHADRGGAQALVGDPEDRDEGSPVGIVAAGAGVAALGFAGVWVRRRRRLP